MIHENAQHATSLKELAGKRVSVVYRHYWHNYLESRYPDIILDPVSNSLQGLFRVMSGHSDALVDYKASVLPKLEDNTHLRLQATSTIPAQSGLSIGVRSDWPAGSAASRRSTFPRAHSGPACSALKSSCPSCC